MNDRVKNDRAAMRRTFRLARRGLGRVEPNPMVGAVIVRDGRQVGEGFHTAYGRAHAEVEALRAAGRRARGATLYVNLEPCTHSGNTPPCVPTIVEAGIRRVVIGTRDPNPEAAGGSDVLRRVGVEVTEGVLESEARRLNASFLWRHLGNGPFVTLKLAMSLDGRISAAPGVRTRLSGGQATAYAHRLRAAHDSVLIGSGTALADDPYLTVRGPIRPRRSPLRVVLDSRLSVSEGARLVTSAGEAPVLLLAGPEASDVRKARLEGHGVEVMKIERLASGGLNLRVALEALAERGVRSVLAEGGSEVAASLLAGGFVHKLCLILVPRLIGEGGVSAFARAGAVQEGAWRIDRRMALGEDTALEFFSEAAIGRLEEAE